MFFGKDGSWQLLETTVVSLLQPTKGDLGFGVFHHSPSDQVFVMFTKVMDNSSLVILLTERKLRSHVVAGNLA